MHNEPIFHETKDGVVWMSWPTDDRPEDIKASVQILMDFTQQGNAFRLACIKLARDDTRSWRDVRTELTDMAGAIIETSDA